MSLAIDLTQCQERIAQAGKAASATVRRLKTLLPTVAYDELMLAHCAVAASAVELKTLLGTLRMIGELEPRPPAVTAERLELASCVRASDLIDRIDESEGTRRAFAHELAMIGDDTLSDDQTGLVKEESCSAEALKDKGVKHGQH